MDESPRFSGLQRSAALVIAAVMVAAALAVIGAANASSASAASAGSVAVGSSKLGACKRKAISACRKVTARKCRVSTSKRLRSQDKRVNKRKIARSCAKKAKRHCAKRVQKRKQAMKAARCARPRRINVGARSSGILPTAASTGVPSGTRLKVVRGDITVTKDGTVLSGLDVRGFVAVRASNVTIQNSIIRGRNVGTTGKGSLIAAYGDHTNLLIQNSTLAATYPSMYVDGLKGRNFHAYRLDISRVVDTVQIGGGSATSVVDSWLHDNLHYASGDTTHSDGKTHDDSVQVEGGSNIRIENNRIEGSNNAAIMVTQNAARVSGLTITRNLLRDGACTINADEKGKGAMAGVTISSNQFGASRHYGRTCPMLLPRTSSMDIVSNTWDTGSSVAPRFR